MPNNRKPPAKRPPSALKTAAARARLSATRAVVRGAGKVPLGTADRAARSARRGRLVRVSAASATPTADLRRVAELVRGSDTKTLVLVHSPMCGHCLQMRPAFDVASRALVAQGVQVVEIESAAMNGAMRDGNPLVQAMNVGFVGVPHIRVLHERGVAARTYNGDRSSGSIIDFVVRG
jgi:hypothetical protein